MTTGTQRANAAASPIPILSNRPWKLEFTNVSEPLPGLEHFDRLTITRQEQNLDTFSIIGSVTDAIGTSFYPLNGQIDSKLAVTFFVTIKGVGGGVYFFKGMVKGEAGDMSMAGT